MMTLDMGLQNANYPSVQQDRQVRLQHRNIKYTMNLEDFGRAKFLFKYERLHLTSNSSRTLEATLTPSTSTALSGTVKPSWISPSATTPEGTLDSSSSSSTLCTTTTARTSTERVPQPSLKTRERLMMTLQVRPRLPCRTTDAVNNYFHYIARTSTSLYEPEPSRLHALKV